MSNAWSNLGAKGGARELAEQTNTRGCYKVDKGDATPPKGGDSKFGPDVVSKPPHTTDSPGV